MVGDAGAALSSVIAMGLMESRWWDLAIRSKEGTIIIILGKIKVAARSPDPPGAMTIVSKM